MKDELKDKLYEFVIAHFDKLERRGFLTQSCDAHGRGSVGAAAVLGDEPEICIECAADGFSGELVSLGHDSEAIAIVDGLLKLIDQEPQ